MSKAAELAALIGSQSSLANRNLIINGAMNVIQRGEQTTIQSGYALDRWSLQNNTAGRATVGRNGEVPTGQGFLNSLKLDVTTADTSVAAGDIAWLAYRFEGQDLQQMRKGTSSAKKVTLQFWVRSPKTGTHIVQLYDNDNARHNSKAYTISSANTWEKKILTFEADTTGAFDDDNNLSLQLYFALMAGSDFSSGTLASSAWASFSGANGFVGQVNVFDSTDNNFYLTGVQMQLGEVATAFEYESFGDTLAKCQRYFQPMNRDQLAGYQSGTTALYGTYFNPVEMRADPTSTYSLSYISTSQSGGAFANKTITGITTAKYGSHVEIIYAIGGGAGGSDNTPLGLFHNGTLSLDAEL